MGRGHGRRARLVAFWRGLLVLLVLVTIFGAAGDAPGRPSGRAVLGAGAGPAEPGAPVGPVTRTSVSQEAAEVARTLRLINYYPSGRSWQRMWGNWSPSAFRTDMARAARLGATTVRLVLFPEVAGFPTPDPRTVHQLESAMSIAQQEGLTVQLTLFDYWHDYGDLQGSRTWTTSLLSRYRDDPRVLLVEIQNEMDPSDGQAMAWARDQIRLLHTLLPSTPVIVSVDTSSGLDTLIALWEALADEPPDLYSLHYYRPAKLAHATFQQAVAAVAPTPLIIGEAGYSTTDESSASVARDASEADQAAWYRVVAIAAREAGLSPAAPWILDDLTPTGSPDVRPRREYGFGLYRTDGSPKPAAAVVAAAFAGTLTAAPYNGDFSRIIDRGRAAPGWTPWMPSGSARVRTEEGIDGGNALVFSGTARQEGGVTSWYTVPAEPVHPGQVWTVTVYARGHGASGTNAVALAWFDGEGRWLGNTSSVPLDPGLRGWQTLVADGVAPDGAQAVEIHLCSEANSGKVAFSRATWTGDAG